MKVEELTPGTVVRHPEPPEPDPMFTPMTVSVTSVDEDDGKVTVFGNPTGQPTVFVGFILGVGTDVEVVENGE